MNAKLAEPLVSVAAGRSDLWISTVALKQTQAGA
jgi:hypothetical protein